MRFSGDRFHSQKEALIFTADTSKPTALRAHLEGCGYVGSRLQSDFPLGTSRGDLVVDLAAFAHDPPDAVSACIGAIETEEDPAFVLPRYRDLGAPVFFVSYKDALQWWSQRSTRPEFLGTISAEDLPGFFDAHCQQLAPEALYRAKIRGRFEGGYQLSLVDVGLMPLVEGEIGHQVSGLVERAIVEARRALPVAGAHEGVEPWLFQFIFRLLAAKVLRDKKVHPFVDLRLSAVDEVLARVAVHYGSTRGNSPSFSHAWQREALLRAAAVLEPFSSLAHITPEALGWVYENTLISESTRSRLGTHSTPPFLVDYLVWHLAQWVEEIEAEKRHVFEPGCGHAPFLVAAMRLLRDLLPEGTSPEEQKAFLRSHLHGLELDSFAIELAHLSLTLADIPNPDGWDLRRGDLFSPDALAKDAGRAGLLLLNPPFERFDETERQQRAEKGEKVPPHSKVTELLRRLLPSLAPGSCLGVIVPQTFLASKEATDVRRLLSEKFEVAEIGLLPGKVFTFSEAESAFILARRCRTAVRSDWKVRYRRTRESDIEEFRNRYAFSVSSTIAQGRLGTAPDYSLFTAELEEIWHWLRAAPKLEDLAEIEKGLEYRSGLAGKKPTCSEHPFEGAVEGFVKIPSSLQLHGLPRKAWMNLHPEVIRRAGGGTVTGRPQVLVNHARVTRGPWRLKAVLDGQGHPFTGRFLALRPKGPEIPLVYLWALLNSPLANAFCFAHSSTRDVLKKTLRAIPVPRGSKGAIQKVCQLAETYLEAARNVDRSALTSQAEFAALRALMLDLDAEVLKLYELPPRQERDLLDLFAGCTRPGVAFTQERYFPQDFKPAIPLSVFLSDEFRKSTAGELRRRGSTAPREVLQALEIALEAFGE